MWSDTARYPDFLGIDARATIPLFVFLLHWSWWTFWIAFAGVAFFWILTRFGYTPGLFLRRVANLIVRGNRAIEDPVIFRRRAKW